MEKSICGPMKTRLPYQLMYFKIRIAHNILAKVFRIEYQQNMWNERWDIWKNPFIVLGKLGFTLDQYGSKLEVPNNSIVRAFLVKFYESLSNDSCPDSRSQTNGQT
jgi:hypothetical protein